MRKALLLTCLFILTLLLPDHLFAQDWVAKMRDHSVNFFEVQKAFNKYYQKKEKELEKKQRRSKKDLEADGEESEIPGYTQYKRWEWLMAPRVSASGERFNPSQVWQESQKYKAKFPSNTAAGNWTFIGPSNTSGLSGAGRLNFVRIHPNNPNTIFVGSPAGGLWKSTDGGITWATNTDQLAQVIGCSDLAIDPTNTDIMYLATGDGDGADTYTVGILKSIDGGLTWNTTGLSYYMGNSRQLSKILIDPSNTSNLIVAGTGGIFRSTDAGVTFNQVQAGTFKDLEFKPGDPTTVYACGAEFYKSTDSGQTWTKITSGLPTAANVSRMAIAVTAADANYIYLIAGLPAPGYGTQGFYKSSNSGTSFVNISTPALGNQQWYDLAIAASPTNSQEIAIGGQTDFIRSTDGGINWNDIGGITHVDYHDIIYTNGNTMYVTSDGGIYRTTNNGSNWTNLNHNLAISEMYGFGQSATNQNLMIQGWQDNGTNRYNGVNWSSILGGDGMLCFIDWNDDQKMWAEYYNGSLQKSTNGGASFSVADNGINETGAWVTPWLQDPIVPSTIYAGFVNLWKSLDGGNTWTVLSSFSTSTNVTNFAVSPANNLVMWVAKPGELYLSVDGGSFWTSITNIPAGTITGIACSNTDENKAWITYSGFNNNIKVLQTDDQGASWINLSASVPNIPVNCITYTNNSNDAIYIGTDVGVFYKDASLNVWQPFYSGLPNVQVTQLSIFYGTPTKLRASTYGRGMWESDLYIPGSYAPTASFVSDKSISCPGAAVQFTDYSAGQPTGWNWSFPGGSPSTSTQQNPLVYYNTPGTFSVTLDVTNSIGNNSATYNNFITITSSPFNAPATTGATICGPGTVNLSATGSGTGTLRWWNAPGGGNVLATGNTYSPTIAGTTNFYVDEDFPGGGIEQAGAIDNSMGAGMFFTANDIRGLYFNVTNPVRITSFEVYPNSDGNRTIEILDALGNTFADTTIFMTASPTNPLTVNVDFILYPGTGYFIKCRGYVDLFRNSAGAVYPYNSTNGDVTITGSNAGSPGYYYFFYNWAYTPLTCNTARALCVAYDTCTVIGINSLSANNQLIIYPNPNNGTFSLKFKTEEKDNFQLKITNAIGQIIYEENINSFTGEYGKEFDMRKFEKGIYMLSIANSNKKIVRKLVTY